MSDLGKAKVIVRLKRGRPSYGALTIGRETVELAEVARRVEGDAMVVELEKAQLDLLDAKQRPSTRAIES